MTSTSRTLRDRVTISLDGAVAHVQMVRPDKLNALDEAMFEALIEAGQAVYETPGVRCVVLSGEGRAFCAGIDLSRLGSDRDGPPITERTHGNANGPQQAAMTWRKLPVPVIAAVHGVCFGGGLQIASGPDIRIAAPDARLSVMEMRWGLVPDMGGYALWRGLVREDRLRELIYTNREFSGEEGAELGFVTHVDANPLARALAMAQDIATRNPHAIRSAKALANRAVDSNTDQILAAESLEAHKLLYSRNQQEAVAAGMAKRAPEFVDP